MVKNTKTADDLVAAPGQKLGVDAVQEPNPTAPQPEPEPVKVDRSHEKIEITRGQLQGLLSRMERLETGLTIDKPKRITERVATLRFHKGKPVIGYDNVIELKDSATGRLVSWMDVETNDKKKERVGYLSFLNGDNKVSVVIKNQKAEKIVKNHGKMTAKNPDERDKTWQPFETNEEVISYRYIATVEVTEGEHSGEVFEVPSSALNQ